MARKKKEEVLEQSTEPILEEEPKVFVGYTQVIEEPKEEFYILRIGETLEDVAKKFNTTVAELNGLNGNIEVVGSNQIRVK